MEILKNKYSLGFFPTPLHKLENLSEKYSDYNIFIKRDDNTGLASGGNKTRKLEYLIQNALDNKCDTVITAGAQQSNHCRQTAAACSKAGLECHLLLGGEQPDNYEGNLLLSHLLGAKIHFTGENRKGEDLPVLKKTLEQHDKTCYIIPYGGSNLTGALGFVNAVKELKEQLIEQSLKIDYIFFSSSSGGMQAGLTLGIELFDLDAQLHPINIDKEEINGLTLEEIVLQIVTEGQKILSINKRFLPADIFLDKDYNDAGYGVITEDERFAVEELAMTEGILLDPVYTGRAFYGMLDSLDNQKIPANSNILFWHTGGMPAIFKYGNKLR